MSKGFFKVPTPKNEAVLDYKPGSAEKKALKATYKAMKAEQVDVPMYIGAQEVRTGKLGTMHPPHEHKHLLGNFHKGDATHVKQAIDAALKAKAAWSALPWEQRASVFLKAADLFAGPYRQKINAATMLAQSKTIYQAEIDAACELIDFLRFNAAFMADIYAQQPPYSSEGLWNRLEYRPLEGFVFAITPFNFTAISGNLPAAPALMGNTVVWKPAETQIYSARIVMEVFREAGLPPGVINLVYANGPEAGEVVFNHKDFAGLHFTGSTKVFQHLWKTIGENIEKYRTYPKIVGETGGKDFVIAHKSANAKQVATALLRGAFEFQGQKCSAASRAYIPSNLWKDVKKYLCEDIKTIKMGSVEDFRNFMSAVIDEKAFDRITGYIDTAKKSASTEVIAGGNYDKSEGYFIEPTVLKTEDDQYTTMCEEIFGPVLTVYVYEKDNFEETLEKVDNTSPYALTGAVFSKDRYAIQQALEKLEQAAGNFYINDKPTGAVVGQQPFGGARGSGTNDKAGAVQNLMRWISPRTIKENFCPPTDFRYPFMAEE